MRAAEGVAKTCAGIISFEVCTVTSAAALPASTCRRIAVAAFAEPDPVNAMIEAHSAAQQAWNDAVKIGSRLYRQDPRLEAAELETSRLSDIKSSRFHDLAAAYS